MVTASSPCGDWVPYKEESCFKFFDNVGMQTYKNAEKTCQANGGTLVEIHYEEEQKFMVDLFFVKNQIADNIWLGAHYDNSNSSANNTTGASRYKWNDGSALYYTNWASGNPKNHPDYCLAMDSDVDTLGKWIDELCQKRQAVVCQKEQIWSLVKLHRILLEVKLNPVPIGFTYVQLPKEEAPENIWPWMIWKDVSAIYEGVFFRAAGAGDAAAFGQIQEGNSNQVDKVETRYGQHYKIDAEASFTKGKWSDWLYSGGNEGTYHYSWRLHLAPGEIRPRNMALRIWKRIG